MYLDISILRRNGRTYKRVLLRESYREGGKVKKPTIANLSACSDQEIEAIQLALKYKDDLAHVESMENLLAIRQGPSVGALWLVYQLACRFGITAALGNTREGKLALWQVIARVIDQGSRLSAVRLAANHAACDVLDLEAFHEEHLHANLDWLDAQQKQIEQRLFRESHGREKVDLFLYDVTSSYLEGEHNELAAFGYNRDGKKGKKQIVIGLLCDRSGTPLSVEAFSGNTQDTKTFGQQVAKVAARFGGGAVTFVGERGMIKGPQIEQLQQYDGHELHYITAITKPPIEKLLREGTVQIGLFDQTLAEVQANDSLRYVLRRNPERVAQVRRTRAGKYRSLLELLEEQNQYLQEHPRATTVVSQRKVEGESQKLKISDWVMISCEQRTLSLPKDTERLQELEKLDGCYVLKTDLSPQAACKEVVHQRYKDLALVEWAFRTSKTGQLEVRPIHVKLASRTRGHVFVVMLAYWLIKELSCLWKSFDVTVEEGLNELHELCVTEVALANGHSFYRIPEPRELSQQLLEAADVKMPVSLSNKGVRAVTKRKLTSSRKVA